MLSIIVYKIFNYKYYLFYLKSICSNYAIKLCLNLANKCTKIYKSWGYSIRNYILTKLLSFVDAYSFNFFHAYNIIKQEQNY
jgi:hypothetical protein